MDRLIMHWKNDGTPAAALTLPEGFRLVTFPELDNAVEHWLDLMQYGHTEGREDFNYYKKCMLELPCYEEDKCFFILKEGTVIATITVVCNRETKAGLIHKVGSHPDYRGQGVGNMLGRVSEYVLKTAGMQTASLKTDDYRIPAIKVYLRTGFQPDLSTEDYVKRWDAIYRAIGLKD